MINRKILQQEIGDYQKVLGVYDAQVGVYNAAVEDMAKTPYVVNYENGYGLTTGIPGHEKELRSSGYDTAGPVVKGPMVGSPAEAPPLWSGDYYANHYFFVDNKDKTATLYAQGDNYAGGTYKVVDGTYKILPEVPLYPGAGPSFTQAQISQLQNPTATYADALRSEASRLNDNTGHRPTGDTSKGILQRILEGKA